MRIRFFIFGVGLYLGLISSAFAGAWSEGLGRCPNFEIAVVPTHVVTYDVSSNLAFQGYVASYKAGRKIGYLCSMPIRYSPLHFNATNWRWEVTGNTGPFPNYGQGPTAMFQNAVSGTGVVTFTAFAETADGYGMCDTIKTATATFSVLGLDLDADTDRNGVIDDEDEEGEDAWTKDRGAIFNVNYDDENGDKMPDAISFDDSGIPTNENFVIDNKDDEEDLTPFVVRKMGGAVPSGMKVYIRVGDKEQIQSIHVFKKTAAGERSVWGSAGDRVTGGSPEPLDLDVTSWVDSTSPDYLGDGNGDVTFGLEGLFFRNLGKVNAFRGYVELSLELRDGDRVVGHDTVMLKVAPWILLPETQPSKEIWAGRTPADNAAFLYSDKADYGYVGLDHSGQLKVVDLGDLENQFFQDHVEIGYTQRPGGPKTYVVFRAPYDFQQPQWPLSGFLKSNVGIFQLGGFLGYDSGSTSRASGGEAGNIQPMPPSARYGLGRVVVGNTMCAELKNFLSSQEVQPLLEVDTSWLEVGHADEMMAFTEQAQGMVTANPDLAYELLESIPEEDRTNTMLFTQGERPQSAVVTSSDKNTLRIDQNVKGKKWKYARIVADAGSQASGQIAHLVLLENGYVKIDQVWDTTSKIVNGSGVSEYMTKYHQIMCPSDDEWFVLPQAGDTCVFMEDTLFWIDYSQPNFDGTPVAVSVAEVLRDNDLRQLNSTVQGRIHDAEQTLNNANDSDFTFFHVPVLFMGDAVNFDAGRTALAFTPNLSNAQEVNGSLYFPRQYGPDDADGNNLFEQVTRSNVEQAQFVDDWRFYHRLKGNVHCGSVTQREPFDFNWWEKQP